jgi:inner membrane transporter RhtA
MNLSFYMAIARIPLAVAIAIEFTGPLVLAIVSSRRALDFVWIGFAVLGLGLLLPLDGRASGLDLLGVAYALGAGVCWALYIITGKRAGNVHGGQATSLGLLVATLVVLPVGFGQAATALLNPAWLGVGLAVGILSSAVPYSLEMVALKRLRQETFGILLSLEPAVGAVAAWIILGERLTPLQSLAIACIVVASVGSAKGANRDAAASP